MRTQAENPEPAEWLAERLLSSWSGPEQGNLVGAIVPTGFEAYARVFPSPEVPDEEKGSAGQSSPPSMAGSPIR